MVLTIITDTSPRSNILSNKLQERFVDNNGDFYGLDPILYHGKSKSNINLSDKYSKTKFYPIYKIEDELIIFEANLNFSDIYEYFTSFIFLP